MLWNTAAFRVVNEAWRIAPPAEGQGKQVNGLVHRLIVDGFVADQVLAVRRLTDGDPIQDTKKKRAVFSLISLLRDMKANVRWMTRARLFEALRLHHDTGLGQHELAGGQENGQAEASSFIAEERNEQIDFLAEVIEKERSPDDTVRAEVFEHMELKVENSCKELNTYANKFLAHAADSESRQDKNADKINVTLNHIYCAQEAICKVANFVGATLLDVSNIAEIPTPQYNHLEYIDKPLVKKDNIPALYKVWEEYKEQTQKWTNWGTDELRQEMTQ